jgi:hypothetical protein
VAISAFHSTPLSEANNKADYSFASAKPAEGSEHVNSLPARKPTSEPGDPDSEQVYEVSAESLSGESPEHPPRPCQIRQDSRVQNRGRHTNCRWCVTADHPIWKATPLRPTSSRTANSRQSDTPPRKSSRAWIRSSPRKGIVQAKLRSVKLELVIQRHP